MSKRLFLVVDDGSGEASSFALAESEEEAVGRAAPLLVVEGDDASMLRAVNADTTKTSSGRALLSLWEPIALEALQELTSDFVEHELNALESIVPAAVRVVERRVAEAVAATVAEIRAEVERRRADRRARFESNNKIETLHEELALHRLILWLDSLSKGKA